jgi:hypothetical protein
MEIDEAILKRIRALLAMSRGNANENEAAVAAQKVQQLLTDYNLSLSDVENSEPGRIIEDGDLMTSSSNPWRRSLGTAVARLYLCDYYWQHVYVNAPHRKRPYVRGDRHNFIGLPHNVVVAKEMFVYLVDTVERLAKEGRAKWVRKHGRVHVVEGERVTAPAYENAFRFGCAKRIENRIWERYHEATAPPAGLLVKSNVPALYKGMDARIADYMEKNHKDLMTIDKYAGRIASIDGVIDGHAAGERVSLDTQLGQEQPKRLEKR